LQEEPCEKVKCNTKVDRPVENEASKARLEDLRPWVLGGEGGKGGAEENSRTLLPRGGYRENWKCKGRKKEGGTQGKIQGGID